MPLLRSCQRCGFVGLWFRFYRKDLGLYVANFDICRRCAGDIQYLAVMEYQALPPAPSGRPLNADET